MTFKVEFKLNGAAIDEGRETEISALLEEIATRVRDGRTSGLVIDSNGGTLGKWSYEYDIAHSEPDDEDDAWNDTDRYVDDDGNEVEYAIKWSQRDMDWYEADKVVWDEKLGDYVLND